MATSKRTPPPPRLLPFSAEQRRYLCGRVWICIAGELMVVLFGLVFTGILRQQLNLAREPALLLAAICAPLVVFAWQYWRDLRLGGARSERLVLERIVLTQPHYGTVRLLYFKGVGRLQVHGLLSVPPSEGDIGRTMLVSYSPHSRTLWSVGP